MCRAEPIFCNGLHKWEVDVVLVGRMNVVNSYCVCVVSRLNEPWNNRYNRLFVFKVYIYSVVLSAKIDYIDMRFLDY